MFPALKLEFVEFNCECILPNSFLWRFSNLQANVSLPFTFITDPTLPQFTTCDVSPQVSNHQVSPAPECSNLTMTAATFLFSSHYVSVCSSSFSKLR